MSPTTRTSRTGSRGRTSPMPWCSAWADRASGPKCWPRPSANSRAIPKLHVLDSTDPAQVRSLQASVNVADTLFIVSSKSGGTTEPNVMKDYFFARVSEAIGADKAGHRFIAVTDPGSSLEKVADQAGLCPHLPRRSRDRRTLFGAVAVRAGAGRHRRHRFRTLLEHTLAMVRSCGPDVPPHENPGRAAGPRDGLRRPRRPRQGDDPVVEEDRRFRRLGRTTDRRIHRQGRQGPDPDRRRNAGRAAAIRQRPLLHRHPHRRRRRRGARRQACRAGKGRPSGGAHRDEIDRPYRPGILPVRDGHRGGRRDARHQPVQPARRRGRQDQDPGIDRGVRENRFAAR